MLYQGLFLGQEVVVRLRDRGQLPRKLVSLRITGDALPPAKASSCITSTSR
ncbi:MAG: hypothetical protein U0787_18745 [Polyangia bacterium]